MNTQHDVSDTIAISAAPLNVAVAFANAVKCLGYNQLTLEIELDRTAATQLQIAVNSARLGAPTVMYAVQAGDASPFPDVDLKPLQYTYDYAGDARLVVNIPLNYEMVSCTFTSTAGVAADTITVKGRLGVV